ncbi:MAG: hypothetical protein KDJ98_20830, partial [Rhodobacteraceae bacterium]|nr:hypothetical protein [Paracoccaceae bacterium]
APALPRALADHPWSIDLALIAVRADPGDAAALEALRARVTAQNRRKAALARQLWALGRPEAALQALDALDPASETWRGDRVARAELTLLSGGTPEGLDGAEGFRLSLLALYRRQGAAALAERIAGHVGPDLPWSWLIGVFLDERDFRRTRALLDAFARQRGADHPAVRAERIRLALECDDPATARAEIDTLGAADTPWLWPQRRLAQHLRCSLLEAADPDHPAARTLADLADRVLRLYPGNAVLRALALSAREMTGDWDALATDLATDTADPPATARALLRLGLPEAALTAVCIQRSAPPDQQVRTRLREAEIRLRMGDLAGAGHALGTPPAAWPLRADHAYWAAEIALAGRDPAAALAALAPALRDGSARMGLHLSAARAGFLAGDLTLALDHLTQFRRLKTDQLGEDPGEDLRDRIVGDAANATSEGRGPETSPGLAARALALSPPGFTATAGAIPRQLAHYWEGPRSAPVERGLRAWAAQHPDLSQQLFDAAGATAWLSRHTPDLTALFQRQTLPAARADLFRLAWILHQGGVFTDLDEYPRAPVTPWLEGARAVLVIEEGHGTIANNFLAAEPGLPLFARTLDGVARTLAETEAPYPWWHSGPAPLTVQALAASRDAGESPGLRFLGQPDYDTRVATNLPFPHKRGALHWR